MFLWTSTRILEPIQKTKQYTTTRQWLLNKTNTYYHTTDTRREPRAPSNPCRSSKYDPRKRNDLKWINPITTELTHRWTHLVLYTELDSVLYIFNSRYPDERGWFARSNSSIPRFVDLLLIRFLIFWPKNDFPWQNTFQLWKISHH